MLGLAGKLTRVATIRSAWGRTLRNLVLRLLNHVPPFRRRLAMNLSGLSRREFARLPERGGVVAGRSSTRQPARAAPVEMLG